MIILFLIQMAVTIVTGIYFYTQLRKEKHAQPAARHEGAREMDKLRQMRAIRLSEPLSEHVRPQTFDDIIGQREGIKALTAILCGSNPQHVIIYGPPGIGKTCAARLVLEAAKAACTIPSIRGRAAWACRASRSPSRGLLLRPMAACFFWMKSVNCIRSR